MRLSLLRSTKAPDGAADMGQPLTNSAYTNDVELI